MNTSPWGRKKSESCQYRGGRMEQGRWPAGPMVSNQGEDGLGKEQEGWTYVEYCKGSVLFIPSAWFSFLPDGPWQVCHITPAIMSHWVVGSPCGLKFFLMGQRASTFSCGLEMLLHLPEAQFLGFVSFRIPGTPLSTPPLVHCALGTPPPFQTFSIGLASASWCPLHSYTLYSCFCDPRFHQSLPWPLCQCLLFSSYFLLPLVLSPQWAFSKLFFTSLFWVSAYSIIRWESITSGCLTGREGVGGEANAAVLWVVGFMNSDILCTSSMVGWPVFFPVFPAPWKEQYSSPFRPFQNKLPRDSYWLQEAQIIWGLLPSYPRSTEDLQIRSSGFWTAWALK